MNSMTDPLWHDALERYASIVERARQTPLLEPTAAVLATVDAWSRPAARVVLVRHADLRGFVFYTNSTSRKGRELAANADVALCLYWDPLHEQARIEGHVVPASDEESDLYWRSRPRESQIGAWASRQSQVLSSRRELEEAVVRTEVEFAGREVPRPTYWHGYRVVPRRIEFWRGVVARLHERDVYELTDGTWHKYLLFP